MPENLYRVSAPIVPPPQQVNFGRQLAKRRIPPGEKKIDSGLVHLPPAIRQYFPDYVGYHHFRLAHENFAVPVFYNDPSLPGQYLVYIYGPLSDDLQKTPAYRGSVYVSARNYWPDRKVLAVGGADLPTLTLRIQLVQGGGEGWEPVASEPVTLPLARLMHYDFRTFTPLPKAPLRMKLWFEGALS